MNQPTSSPAIAIRVATEADIPAMHQIRLQVRENQLSDRSLVQPHHYCPFLNENGRGWVAESEGSIIGFAIADGKNRGVWALFVDPCAEGAGIGRRLHDKMLEWFFATSDDQVHLTTEPGTRAERFYRAAGWEYLGLTPNGEANFKIARASAVNRDSG
ncbi:N/A [soil metagenome]